ncbi:translation initiation factor [Mangrovibacterium marinum]|uniref:Translation initiation factor 1 (eIF-1/SUI1) n=1 Tax=Mangrovibacterium marinum TaxID=1639118 RepID=A0A2T5BX82_9BACT|nr:translation initiation factor [Mangrovibacterium marinum]PTN04335.1 translation initiation factor 1 (eIF-1/SUI1) [Mangrovibacterium marinum]
MEQDWKDKLGKAFSVSPDSQNEPEHHEQEQTPSIPANKQTLYVELDKKGRKGKSATLITGFEGTDDELKELARMLKTQCGVGGSTRDGEILIQGNFRDKIMGILKEQGFKVKRIGG